MHGYLVSPRRLVGFWTDVNLHFHRPFISHFYQDSTLVGEMLKKIGVVKVDIEGISQELTCQYQSAFDSYLTKDPKREAVQALLRRLRDEGLRLSVLSNERHEALCRGLAMYGIRCFFEGVVSSEILHGEKQEPGMFEKALRIMRIRASSSVYVGDDLERDIAPALRVGMRTIQYIPPSQFRKNCAWRNYSNGSLEKPDATVRRLSLVENEIRAWRSGD